MNLTYKSAVLVAFLLAGCHLSSGARQSEERPEELDTGESGRIMATLPPPGSNPLFGLLDSTHTAGLLKGPPFSSTFQQSSMPGYQSDGLSFYDQSIRNGKQMSANALSSLASLSPATLLALGSANSYGYMDSLANSELNDHQAVPNSNYASSNGGNGHYQNQHHHQNDHHVISHPHPFLGKFTFGKDPHSSYETPVNYSAVGLLGFLALLALIQTLIKCRRPDCNSALGLLAVLGLVSFLQNVLTQLTSTTAAPLTGRMRRSTDFVDFNPEESLRTGNEQIIALTLPLLTAAAHAKDGLIPVNCAYLDVCKVNHELVKALGTKGRSVALSLTKAVHQLLKSNAGAHAHLQILKAGKVGRNVTSNCDQYFSRCRQLELLPSYTIPVTMMQSIA